MPKQLKNLLKNPKSLSDSKCENCGHGRKYRTKQDNYVNGAMVGQITKEKKWRERCIDIWRRKNYITPTVAEPQILREVGGLYSEAQIADLDKSIQEKITKLERGRDLFLFGPVGTGKTYVMAAMLRHYIYEGFLCKRINFDDFCTELRSTMSPGAQRTEWEIIKPLRTIDKLFIDDLGLRSKQETDFAYVTLYSIFNKRQEYLLPTFLTSNKNIDQLSQQFDARIASRLRTAEIIEMNGKDRRRC